MSPAGTRSRAALVVVVALVAASLVSCRTVRHPGPDEMYELGPALTKLSRAVEVAVRYGSVPPGLEDDALIDAATQHDPGLKAPFLAYRLRAKGTSGHAVVLVCTKDGLIGLLEDAGCSAQLDAHLWRGAPAKPCAFTLDVGVACPAVPPQ